MFLKQFLILIILLSTYHRIISAKYVINSDYMDRNIKTTHQENDTNVASLADLYYFHPNDVKGIFNCSYKDTVNITDKRLSPNGSYSYDKYTLIPPHLVGDYEYEILYNGSKRLVKQHKRACICHLKLCITFCSNIIPEVYNYVVSKEMESALELFLINVTLKNTSIVTKNIAKDFAPIVLNEFCEVSYFLSPEVNPQSSWTLFENGDLEIKSDKKIFKRNEYCFDLQQITLMETIYDVINPRLCAGKVYALGSLDKYNYYIQILSVIFLLLTIIVYCCIPELLNVHGKCLISYAGALAMSFSIFCFINLSGIEFNDFYCALTGYLNIYLQLSHFTWLAIICHDIWKSFSELNYYSTYRRYAKYGFTIPIVMVIFTYIMQNLDIYEFIKPGINTNRCGLDANNWSAVIYLHGPTLLILLYCCKCYMEVYKIIKTNDQEMKEATVLTLGINPPKRNTLYLRLFILMGVSWNMEIISYALDMLQWNNLSLIVDYINSLQGFYIFINFIVRRRIFNSIHHKFISKVD